MRWTTCWFKKGGKSCTTSALAAQGWVMVLGDSAGVRFPSKVMLFHFMPIPCMLRITFPTFCRHVFHYRLPNLCSVRASRCPPLYTILVIFGRTADNAESGPPQPWTYVRKATAITSSTDTWHSTRMGAFSSSRAMCHSFSKNDRRLLSKSYCPLLHPTTISLKPPIFGWFG